MKYDPFRSIAHELAELDRDGLLRRAAIRGPLQVMCSNDYLGLGATEERVSGPAGAGASPLVSGYTDVHEAAAVALAEWLRCEGVTLFTSGYAANVGVLQALGGEGVVLFSDALNHASIIDGCRLSRSRVEVFPHLDLGALERALVRASSARDRWVVTESYFSMDGDSPDLARLRAVCDEHDAGLILDEAHAIGVFGPEGRGLAAEAGVHADVLIGTLGKSFGLHGAFVGGGALLRTVLWNRARSLVFSTAGSPLVLSLVPDRVRQVAEADGLRLQLAMRSESLRRALSKLVTTLTSSGRPARVLGHGPIAPLVVGDVGRAIELSTRIASAGYLVKPMRPPTVPEHASRLRFTATLGPTPAVVESFESLLASLS